MARKKTTKDKSKSSANDSEVKRLTKIVKKMPDVRQEKVDEIKRQIESGKYNVPTESVVESIVAHHKELNSEETPVRKSRKNR